MKSNFEIKVFTGFVDRDKNSSFLARMHNVMVRAIRERKRLAKCIVVVLEDNLINDAQFGNHGASRVLGDMINWIAKGYEILISKYKESWPAKAIKEGYPKFLWFTAPFHHDSFTNNDICKKFNTSLYSAISVREGMNTVKLKGNWNSQNFRLVNNGILTGEGICKYWEAVDSGFKFWLNVMIEPSIPVPAFKRKQSSESSPQSLSKSIFSGWKQRPNRRKFRRSSLTNSRGHQSNNKFYWERKHYAESKEDPDDLRRKLPKPSTPHKGPEQ